MKLYRNFAQAHMSFGSDPKFAEALEQHLLPAQIDTIIETGTFTGQGSTKTLAEFFQRSRPPKAFTDIEAAFAFFSKCKGQFAALRLCRLPVGRNHKPSRCAALCEER